MVVNGLSVVTSTFGNFGKISERLKIDSKEVFGVCSLIFFSSCTCTTLICGTVVVVALVVLVVIVDATVDVDVFLGRGENLFTGFSVVLLKSPESIDDGVNSVLLGNGGRRVVGGFWVDGL